jgi:hypothetical protein
MKLLDKAVQLMSGDEKKRYAYISKSKVNMTALNLHVSQSVDFSKTKVTIFVANPIIVNKISGKLDGVFADKSSTSEEHLRKFLDLTPEAFIQWVDPTNLEVIDDTPVVNDVPKNDNKTS